jgi:hypothetical protein
MAWRVEVTHDRLVLTRADILSDKEHFSEYFADLHNPTDEEIRNYFKAQFEDFSDPWEILANGNFRIILEPDK